MGIAKICRARVCFGKNGHKIVRPVDQIFISISTTCKITVSYNFSVRHFTNFPRIFCQNFQSIFRLDIFIRIRKDTERIDPWHFPVNFHLGNFIDILEFETYRVISITFGADTSIFWDTLANTLTILSASIGICGDRVAGVFFSIVRGHIENFISRATIKRIGRVCCPRGNTATCRCVVCSAHVID